MALPTRRDFLAASCVWTGGMFGVRSHVAVSGNTALLRRGQTADAFLPRDIPPSDFQQLAIAATDAARAAGAAYADVRVAERHRLRVATVFDNPLAPDVFLYTAFNYGIRVLVDGMWMFAHGTTPHIDAITERARNAVATARGCAVLLKPQGELAPAPVVQGEWTSPCQIDPFTVPIEDQRALLWACTDAATRPLGGATVWPNVDWTRETRIFASTEGSLVTQHVYRAEPGLSVDGDRGMGRVELLLPQLVASTGGYERVLVPDLQEQIKATAEEVVRFARLPQRPMEVGRYPVVLDGSTMGMVVGSTIGPALELDRVVAHAPDSVGTSFLAPVEAVLDQPLFPEMMNVRADRALPSVHAVQWDDEGVVPTSYPVITNGQIVDFHTSRQTVSALREWYARRGQPMQSHGCAVASQANEPVLVRMPHLTMAPGKQTATIDDLCREIRHGLLIRQAPVVYTDPQFASGGIHWGIMCEIERGKVVRRIHHTGLDFTTRGLWKGLVALGDAMTIGASERELYKGHPWTAWNHTVTAPAGYFSAVNVIAVGRHA